MTVGLVAVVAGAAAIVFVLVRQAEALRFVRGQTIASAVVVDSVPWNESPDSRDRLVVEFRNEDELVRASVAVFARARYPIGTRLDVAYDPDHPRRRVVPVQEPYDPVLGLFLGATLAAFGAAGAVRSLWWTRRVQALAAAPIGAFLVRASFTGHDDLFLSPLDDETDAARTLRVRLMRGYEEMGPRTFAAHVKGDLVAGGLLVAQGDGHVWWPKRNARTRRS